MSAAPILRLSGVTRVFGEGEAAVTVLRGIDLEIAAGEFVAIVGQSGSGKSTLMNIMAALDRPSEGSVRFRGQETGALGLAERAQFRRAHFGFVFQRYHLIPALTALENVEIPALYGGAPGPARRARAARLLDRLGLADRAHHRPGELSGGQQQRVAIARALMNDPEIVFADEPTGALDSESGRAVMTLMRAMHAEGRTVVMVTHDAALARAADRIVTLHDGRVVSDEVLRPRSAPEALHAPRPAPAGAPPALGAALTMAWRALGARRLRSLLTMLGILIGVASVVAMMAIGAGAREQVLASIRAMGTDLIEVKRGARNVRGGEETVRTLLPGDLAAIARLPEVLAAIPETNRAFPVRAGEVDHRVTVVATGADFPRVRDWRPVSGRFFEREHEERHALVAAIGWRAWRILFPDGRDPVGEYIRIGNTPFQVIALMERKGVVTGGGRHDRDEQIWVPSTTGASRLLGHVHVADIVARIRPEADLAAAERNIHRLLLERHGQEDFHLRNMSAAIAQAEQTQSSFALLLGSVAAISLLVGGIGVMNIMLVSVTERTAEIGLRTAVGARPADVTLQFLIESACLCLAGGVLGVALGVGASLALPHLAPGFASVLTPEPVLLALLCALGCGLVFGIAPARRAARLDPVGALAGP
ncbi:MacB family efflux pump subunit [Rubritepida flocculans]|uniref:MacB family efflux pump subunit n=1 Tax=Rubritepida flocculans TaxID=182403 RepID=UPI00041B868C|nr:MacB family efflux pump subunit [Rubritepida flocculans]